MKALTVGGRWAIVFVKDTEVRALRELAGRGSEGVREREREGRGSAEKERKGRRRKRRSAASGQSGRRREG
jgi:hypothetical protein